MDDIYEVYAIRYATRASTRAATFLDADPHDGPMGMDYFIWALRKGNRTIVVDTGFDKAVGERRGRTFLRCPVETLRDIGIQPEEVSDVILTHLHNDHAGNLDKFPAAQFHLQDAEMAFATGRYMRHACCGRAYEFDHMVGALRLNYTGRIEFHEGMDEIADGVTVHPAGGHTAGLQFVRVRTRGGWFILASDASHYYENFQRNNPFRLVFNVGKTLDGYRAMRRLAGSEDKIIPGHDPQVMERFPAVSPELEGIAVRLD
ncbi:N-acyl homoserine lactonase family protein [Aquabacter sp. CN5-332]|uniref:N-acyl homoserine lactonase family protein n=1 Tax=Aquabacter sp. CN5-332 TaxID=3156608 RepID=UPI0032B622E4